VRPDGSADWQELPNLCPLIILDTEADGLVPCASAGAPKVAGAGDSLGIDAPHECIVAPGGETRNGSGGLVGLGYGAYGEDCRERRWYKWLTITGRALPSPARK
jgi:hypothetical protein